jgi:hypothetical protein
VAGGLRRLHNEELHDLYASPNIIRVIKSRGMRCARHVARMGDMRNVYSIVVGRPEGRIPRGSHRRRWEDNIRLNLRKIEREAVDWMHLT